MLGSGDLNRLRSAAGGVLYEMVFIDLAKVAHAIIQKGCSKGTIYQLCEVMLLDESTVTVDATSTQKCHRYPLNKPIPQATEKYHAEQNCGHRIIFKNSYFPTSYLDNSGERRWRRSLLYTFIVQFVRDCEQGAARLTTTSSIPQLLPENVVANAMRQGRGEMKADGGGKLFRIALRP